MNFEKLNKTFVPKTWKHYHYGKAHRVDIINDGELDLIVYKYWRKNKKGWEYGVMPRWEYGYKKHLDKQFKKQRENHD